jgi:hypothetical protein
MAQKSSRSKKVKKQPELRTGGGRSAKAKRSQERQASAVRTTSSGPVVRMRPAGAPGYLFWIVMGWLGVAAVLGAAYYFNRWFVFSYPDSLWLYTAIGGAAVAPALASFARSQRDIDSWLAQTVLVSLGMYVAEYVLGPECPAGGDCAVVGARGSLGLVWSLVIIVGLGVGAWVLARFMFERARDRRPASGRVKVSTSFFALLWMLLLIGAPLAAAMTGVDMLTRATPGRAADAADYVENHCLQLGASSDLLVRPAPSGIASMWQTFAVRNADEDRPAVGKRNHLPKNWATYDSVLPYEALVSYNGDEVADLNCRKIDPASGNATAADMQDNVPASNALDPQTTGSQFFPQFYTQGPHKPTPEETKAAAAKQAATAKKTAAAVKAAASTK